MNSQRPLILLRNRICMQTFFRVWEYSAMYYTYSVADHVPRVVEAYRVHSADPFFIITLWVCIRYANWCMVWYSFMYTYYICVPYIQIYRMCIIYVQLFIYCIILLLLYERIKSMRFTINLLCTLCILNLNNMKRDY